MLTIKVNKLIDIGVLQKAMVKVIPTARTAFSEDLQVVYVQDASDDDLAMALEVIDKHDVKNIPVPKYKLDEKKRKETETHVLELIKASKACAAIWEEEDVRKLTTEQLLLRYVLSQYEIPEWNLDSK